MSETLREKMARLATAQLPTVKQAVATAARRYFVNGTMSFPAEALVAVLGNGKTSSRLDEMVEGGLRPRSVEYMRARKKQIPISLCQSRECHDLFRLCGWDNLPVSLGFFRRYYF